MTRNTLAVLAALTSLALAAPAAADPFEQSRQLCIDSWKMESACFTYTAEMQSQYGDLTIGTFLNEIGYSIEKIRERNTWGTEVTPDTIVPIGASFVFG